MIEFKILPSAPPVMTYSQLGLSGAQDHHIRQITRRVNRGACVVTGPSDSIDELSLWIPVSPEIERENGLYRQAAIGDACIRWVLG